MIALNPIAKIMVKVTALKKGVKAAAIPKTQNKNIKTIIDDVKKNAFKPLSFLGIF